MPHNVHTNFISLFHLYYSPIMYTPILLLIWGYTLCFLWCLMQNMFKGWQKLCLWWLKILFLKFWVENKCFWKTFKLILMYFIHEIICFEWFLHKLALFFKKLIFPDFRSIEAVTRPIEIALKFLVWICLTRLVLDWSKLENFQFLDFWPNFFSCIIYV